MKNERENNDLTVLLYESDGLMMQFDAKVTGSGRCDDSGRDYVVLDRTAFFPGGGGQQADEGFLVTAEGNRIEVFEVASVSGIIRHYVKEPIQEGMAVKGMIDPEKRIPRMQVHGAEHLISGLIHNRFGYDNVGFHMSDDETVFDVSGPLTDEQIRDIEQEANRLVFENVPFTISFPSPKEARNLEYRSKLDIFENVRLVTIEGVDSCACCAPHVDFTGRLGVIKILSSNPHRGGTRITMTAGLDAYRDYVSLHESNAGIMEILSARRDRTAEFASSFMEKFMTLKEENTSLRKELTRLVTDRVLDDIRADDSGRINPIFAEGLDPTGLRDLVNECTRISDGIICAFLGDDKAGYRYIFAINAKKADSTDIRSFASDFNEKCAGKGGGSRLMVQGTSTADRRSIERYFDLGIKMG